MGIIIAVLYANIFQDAEWFVPPEPGLDAGGGTKLFCRFRVFEKALEVLACHLYSSNSCYRDRRVLRYRAGNDTMTLELRRAIPPGVGAL